MGEVKITDLVEEGVITRLRALDTELKTLLDDYTNTAKELAKGLQINVKLVGDIDKLDKLYVEKTKEATTATERLNAVVRERGTVIANTTNTISRQLMEQERVNKTQREAYTDTEKFKALLERVNGSYEQRVQRLVQLEGEIKTAKEREKALNEEYTKGQIDQKHYTEAMTELRMQTRSLMQEKADLTTHLKNEEREMQSVEGSYRNLSQRLELMKKAYKDLTEEERNSSMGKEMETAIQNLDAHLKDVSADMGEFQRNVGNYAIAGQNGVVTTESVIAAMNQQAITTQDLVDQTKILEEAKNKLNTNDANYQQTLDSLNAKIEDNKRKLMDVSDIVGKEAHSVAEAEAQNKRLSEAIKHIDLTSADAKKRLEEMRSQIERNNQVISEATGANEKLADSLLGTLGINTNFGKSLESLGHHGNVIDGLSTKVKAFGKTLMGILSNPWVLAFLGIGGIVAGFKWWYDYNKGLIEASRLTENFTGLTGEAADKVTADMQAMADHMGKSYDDTIGAANTLVQQFGISWEDAKTLMEDGIQAGADMNGKFVENINQFAPALRDAGVSAQELVSILAETRNGIFNEQGVQDIIKGGPRLRAMTKQISESLDACGISSKQMQKDLEEGNITMLDAVQQVAAKLKELPENSQEAGMVMKNVFGRTAAEGGTLLIQSIADVNTNLDVAKERMGELGEVNREQMEAQKELNEVLASVFKSSGTSFEKMTTKAKTFVIQGLTSIIKRCVDIVNWFIRIYNESTAVRMRLATLVAVFKSIWSVAKGMFTLMLDGFKNIGTAVEGILQIFEGDFEKGFNTIKNAVVNGARDLKNTLVDTGKEIGNNFADELTGAATRKLQKVEIGMGVDISGLGARESGGGSKDKPEGIPTDDDKKKQEKAAKEAEKAAKEELKRINELEESKINLMADGHEKELAQIRLKYKKKLDEIQGNGETEKALRVQLAAECENEVAKCELQYQTQLAKINLDNRLAAVEKGSKEELDLKLAKLEAERAAEIKEAEKTGADVALINAKFNKQREEMEEDFAESQVDLIMKRYSNENDISETNYIMQSAELHNQYNAQLRAAKGHHSKMEKAEKDYQAKMDRLAKEHAVEQAKATVDMYEELLKKADIPEEMRQDLERQLARARAELAKLKAQLDELTNERKPLIDPEFIEEFGKRSDSVLDKLSTINDFMQSYYDRQIENIERVQEANEAAGEAEQERITDLVNKKAITEEEGEARKRVAEAKTARENEKLEKKKQQLKIKQAKWDKANAIAQATISTALAIMNALNTPPIWLGIAMAAIAAAMGAVQIATIAQQPIPAYAKGTDRHEGGPAIVGDGGKREVVLFNGSAWLTPDTPTLVDIPAGASVLPDVNLLGDNPAGGVPLPVMSDSVVKVYDDTNMRYAVSDMRRAIGEVAQLIKAQTRQQHNDAYMAEYERYKNSKI